MSQPYILFAQTLLWTISIKKATSKLNKFSASACWDGAFKNQMITFCHFANCAHHKTLHLHIHTQQMTLSNPTISQHSSSFVHVNTVLQIQHCSQSPMQPPPYQTPMLSSSNIANSHSNMPHTRTQHCPCTISKKAFQ